jgi:hypothetical protein
VLFKPSMPLFLEKWPKKYFKLIEMLKLPGLPTKIQRIFRVFLLVGPTYNFYTKK